MANKITTYGYFKKRLRDSGYLVDDLFRRYGKADPRAWSVVIDPGGATISDSRILAEWLVAWLRLRVINLRAMCISVRDTVTAWIDFLVDFGMTVTITATVMLFTRVFAATAAATTGFD